jgi:hypothetical protein
MGAGVSLASMAERRKSGGRSGSSGSGSSRSDSGEDRILGAAPSSPDIRKLALLEPSEAAKAHEASKVDAMGQDKRREVVGHSYGPSRKSQIAFFVAIAAIVVVVIGGYAMAIAAFDQPEDEYPAKSPWSAVNAPQNPTRSPAGPCGEPGNAYPPPADSPCAGKNTSTGEPGAPGTTEGRQEVGAGGPTAGGAESESQEPPGN